jgi:hypothetical protein
MRCLGLQLMQQHGLDDTLEFMKEYWVDNEGRDEHFWEVGQAWIFLCRLFADGL